MQVTIRAKDIQVDEELRAHVDRRLQFALGRFGGSVTRVMVRFDDANGPRGGLDKRCQISVTLRPSGNVLIEDFDADVHAVLDRAVNRAASSIGRELRRRLDARRL